MDNLWTRRSNSSKLSLTTPSLTNSGSATPPSTDHPTRNYTLSKRHGGDASSHGGKANPFNLASPANTAIASPTSGASSAFGLGSGAFASFGTARAPKSPGNALDFGSLVGTKPSGTPKDDAGAVKVAGAKVPPTVADLKSSPTAHTLRNTWVFWFRPPISKANGFVEYEKTLHAMASFSSVEDFFTVYRHLKRPSSLPLVSDYHLFKDGIRPVWEDDVNKKGGKWIVRLKKGVADRYWEDLLFAIIGDQFSEAGDEVCGVVLSVRNGEDILSIWTRNDGGRVLKIRETMKRVLRFPPETKVEWKSHDSSIQQRNAIDDARKEKIANHHHHGDKRNGGRDDHRHHPHAHEDKKQIL